MFVLQRVGYTALLLGVLVFVHELGHFLVAKACKVKVLKFSIGFGPRIFGFRRGETEYRVAWLPLGGYVKMAGELPYEELAPEDAGRGFLAQAPWKRGLIVAAGPAFNLIFPVLVYFFVFLGSHEELSTRVGNIEPGLPAAEAHLEPGDRILSVDGQRVQTFDELRSELQPRYNREITLLIERDGKQFSTQLTPAKNIESNPEESVPRGMIGISPFPKTPVVGVPPGSAAAAAGLQTFDRVLSINGQPVRDEVAFNRLIQGVSGDLHLTVERNRPLDVPGVALHDPELASITLPKQPGESYAALGAERDDLYVSTVISNSPAAAAGIRPGDRLLAFNGKPLKSMTLLQLAVNQLEEKPFQLTWRSGADEKSAELHQAKMETKDELGQASKGLELGIRPFNAPDIQQAEKIIRHMGVGEALGASLKIVPEITGKMVVVLGRLVTGHVPLSSLGGPILISQIAVKSAEQGWESFLTTMAVISINLGLMNLLPIPILDGFHLIAALWEGIRRRPIPLRAREIANWVGLAMLLVLMVLVFKNDLTR